MKYVISATELARQVGDVLGRIRYRGDSFVVERNGMPVARIEPATAVGDTSLADALRAWFDAAEPDPDFAEALERLGACDAPPGNPWHS